MKRVLLIEDDRDFADAFCDLMRAHGLTVFHKLDGNEAIELFRTEQPEIVITDIDIPSKNGIELLNEILEINSSTKVLAISGISNKDLYLDAAYFLGAIECYEKPLDVEKLSREVVRLALS